MPDLRAILLDAGNTLVFIDPERVVELFRRAGVDADVGGFWKAEREARAALVAALRPDITGMEGSLWRAYFSTLYRAGGVPEERVGEVTEGLRALHAEAHLWTYVPDWVEPALGTLREAGYRLGVVSNADGRIEALLEARGLGRHLDFVLDSEVVGVAKPDPRIFRMAVERLAVAPGECLYVGDLYPVDVVGARGAGLDAVLVDPYDLFADVDVDRIPSISELPAYLLRRESPAAR